jgi:hypothetical protein
LSSLGDDCVSPHGSVLRYIVTVEKFNNTEAHGNSENRNLLEHIIIPQAKRIVTLHSVERKFSMELHSETLQSFATSTSL